MKRLSYVRFGILLVALWVLAACERETVPKGASSDPSKPDVVVIGSEMEGMYLARAAKDEGLSVIVIDPREKPGGQLVQGEMHYLDEAFEGSGKSLLQGRVKVLFEAYKKGDIRKKEEFVNYFNQLSEGIPIESGISITNIDIKDDPATSKRKVESITYRTKDGTTKTVTARYWVENTDFAALTSKLGLKRIPGIETVFGGAKDHMASSLMMKFRNVDWDKFQKEVNKLGKKGIEEKYGAETTVTDKFTWGFGNVGGRFKPSSSDVFLRGLNTINQRDGDVLINALLLYEVDPSNEESVRKAIELGKSETDRVLPHLRQELPGWEKAEINGYPEYLYVRDYDRYETEYVLQATDLMSGAMYEDNVSIAGYALDLQGTKNHVWGSRKGVPDKYGMPLRSFIPKGYSNVVTAGKNVGASAVAYGSARIQPNTALAGEVIGILLSRIDDKRGLTEMSSKEMKDLHSYVQKKHGIRLSGVTGADKIRHLTEDQRRQLNEGKLVIE